MFAGFEHGDAVPGVQRNRRHQVDGVDLVGAQQLGQLQAAAGHAELIPGRFQNGRVRVADRQAGDARVVQVDRDEFGAKSQPDQPNPDGFRWVHSDLA